MSSIQQRGSYKVGDEIKYMKSHGKVSTGKIVLFHPIDTSLVVEGFDEQMVEINESCIIVSKLVVGDNIKVVINDVKEDLTVLSIHPTDGTMCVFVWSNGTQREVVAFEKDLIRGENVLNGSLTHDALKLELYAKLEEFKAMLNLGCSNLAHKQYTDCCALAGIYTSPEIYDESCLIFCKMKKLISVIEKRIGSTIRELEERCFA